MSDMSKSTVSIRELQQHLKRVMARVEQGQVIDITRRHRPIARLAPIHTSVTPQPWPDLDARAKAVFGDRTIPVSASALVIEERGER
jgi:prevent-host-death family protein